MRHDDPWELGDPLPPDDEQYDLNAARGILFGIALSTITVGVISLLFWWIFHGA